MARPNRLDDAGFAAQDEEYIAIGRKEGATLAFGGERLNRETPGFYLQPALFTDATNEMRISREEIFGPVASVIRAKDYEEALHKMSRRPGDHHRRKIGPSAR